MKLAVQFELKKFDDRIRQLAADQLDTIDEYTKMGKAQKVSEATPGRQVRRREGRQPQTLMIPCASMAAPEKLVREAGSWKKVEEPLHRQRGQDAPRPAVPHR